MFHVSQEKWSLMYGETVWDFSKISLAIYVV